MSMIPLVGVRVRARLRPSSFDGEEDNTANDEQDHTQLRHVGGRTEVSVPHSGDRGEDPVDELGSGLPLHHSVGVRLRLR